MWPLVWIIDWSGERADTRVLAPGWFQRIKEDTGWPVSRERVILYAQIAAGYCTNLGFIHPRYYTQCSSSWAVTVVKDTVDHFPPSSLFVHSPDILFIWMDKRRSCCFTCPSSPLVYRQNSLHYLNQLEDFLWIHNWEERDNKLAVSVPEEERCV